MKKEERTLTKAEEKRLQIFNRISNELEQEGYTKTDLTTSVAKANIVGIIYGLILAVPFAVIFFLVNRDFAMDFGDHFYVKWTILLVAALFLTVVHELIHGLTWGLFAKERFKSIEFGVIWKMLTPYCTCKEPLKKNQYIVGSLMPCLVLGILPCIISWFNQNIWVLLMGVIMIMGAGGDLLISKMILSSKNRQSGLYLDHPTEVGLVVFTKEGDVK